MAQTSTKADISYALLKERIAKGVYGPGYRVVIDQLARETGISSIPLREAIRRLEAEGWLEFIPKVGARVTVFDTNAYTQTMQVLARLEGYATALAQHQLTAEDIEAAREINRDMAQALDDFDPARFTKLNRQFHASIYEHCGDEHLRSLIATERGRLDMIRGATLSYVPGRARASVVEHDALLNLLAAPGFNFDAIEAAARQHNLNTLQSVMAHEASTGAFASE
jgi:DNA-binding GntR family transcriptional regulator